MVGSTDIGDLSHLIPVIQPTMGGYVGNLHALEFGVSDKEFAYLSAAKTMAMTVIDLLFDDAKEALSIKNNFTPLMSKEEYLNF